MPQSDWTRDLLECNTPRTRFELQILQKGTMTLAKGLDDISHEHRPNIGLAQDFPVTWRELIRQPVQEESRRVRTEQT